MTPALNLVQIYQALLQEQYPLTMKALADGTLDGILDKKDLHSPGIFSKTIQDNAYRPLSIAIAGLGDLGKGFLEVLRNKDYVNRFSLFSPTLFEGKNKEFSSIKELKSGSKLLRLDKSLVMGILNISLALIRL